MDAHDTKAREKALIKVKVLTEALPWISSMKHKTFVIKYGGSAMEDPALCKQVISDIELLKLMGIRIVLVHGGGKDINSRLQELDIPVVFERGLRVTDEKTMEVVREVLIGRVNQRLVWTLNEYGHNAVGISGADGKTLQAEQEDPCLGRVGRIREVSPELIENILDQGFTPVVASVASGKDGFYNVNADVAAGKIAEALHADKLIYLTDVDGFYRDAKDPSTLISKISLAEAREILTSADGGMVPKLRSIIEALEHGVSQVVILNGTFPHALLLEIYTDAGCGTMFSRE